MKWLEKTLDKLERTIRPFAIANIAVLIVAGQAIVYFAALADDGLYGALELRGNAVLAGEVWRLLTFVFAVERGPLIFAIFGWLLLYFMGSALEQTWGTARFNLFLLLGYLATLPTAFLVPDVPASTFFIGESIFLAFATLFPDFVIRVMFILPVQIRWLALFVWAHLGYTLLTGSWMARLLVTASLFNYFMFFGSTFFVKMKNVQRRRVWEKKTAVNASKPRHTCEVCGVDSNADPDMDFRYCSQCDGTRAYCSEHLRNHEHHKDGTPSSR